METQLSLLGILHTNTEFFSEIVVQLIFFSCYCKAGVVSFTACNSLADTSKDVFKSPSSTDIVNPCGLQTKWCWF